MKRLRGCDSINPSAHFSDGLLEPTMSAPSDLICLYTLAKPVSDPAPRGLGEYGLQCCEGYDEQNQKLAQVLSLLVAWGRADCFVTSCRVTLSQHC